MPNTRMSYDSTYLFYWTDEECQGILIFQNIYRFSTECLKQIGIFFWLGWTILLKSMNMKKRPNHYWTVYVTMLLVSSRLFRVIHHQQRWKISRILVLLWFVWRVFDYEIDNQRENKCPICYYLKNSFMKKSKAFLNMVVLTFLIAISMLSCQSNDDYLQIGIGNCESSNGMCPITVFH